MYLSGLEVWLNHVNPLAHLNLIKWELQHGESRWARRTMCSFEMPVGPCVSHRAWLLCPLHHSLSPQCFLHLPLCSANHELPCLTRDIANYIHQLHSSEHRSVSAMIPCYFTVPNMSKLSSPVTPQIQSCFPSTFLPHLTAPQLLLLLFAISRANKGAGSELLGWLT